MAALEMEPITGRGRFWFSRARNQGHSGRDLPCLLDFGAKRSDLCVLGKNEFDLVEFLPRGVDQAETEVEFLTLMVKPRWSATLFLLLL